MENIKKLSTIGKQLMSELTSVSNNGDHIGVLSVTMQLNMLIADINDKVQNAPVINKYSNVKCNANKLINPKARYTTAVK